MTQLHLDIHDKLIVDLFAGGGGMSVAMEMAWGRSPDIAINHDDDALSMHRVNHPQTRHFVADVFEVCPRGATQGRPVGWLHLSPDCTHHSQARGGQPRDRKIRALAWVGYRWAGQVRPDVISLENVKQFRQWGPLIAKRCAKTGRVLKLDGSVAEPGERVPVQQQYLVPDPRRIGRTFRAFVRRLEALGYEVQFRTICAADFGGHTTRERLFMIARRDGRPIVWPASTHARCPTGGLQRWKPAAECIDWSIPCPSIFERTRPLAEATMRRIARGIVRHVLQAREPFFLTEHANASAARTWSADEPLRTQCAAIKGGHFALVAPYLMQANGGFNTTPGHDLRRPMSTITNTGSQQQLVAAHLVHLRGNCDARDAAEPLRTVSAGGEHHGIVTAHLVTNTSGHPGADVRHPIPTVTTGSHHGIVECTLSPEQTEGAKRVAAFLMRYYGEGGQWSDARDPMTTITTRDRMALVTVTIRGTPYVVVDIGLRMLTPRELYRAQDFPEDYIIDRGHDGRIFSKATQVRMVGNAVDPLMAVNFLRLNAPALAVRKAA